jgi:hypothetical protein
MPAFEGSGQGRPPATEAAGHQDDTARVPRVPRLPDSTAAPSDALAGRAEPGLAGVDVDVGVGVGVGVGGNGSGDGDATSPATPPPAFVAWATASPVALAALDDAGTIVWANAAFERLAGLHRAAWAGLSATAWLDPHGTGRGLPPPGEIARRTLHGAADAAVGCDMQGSVQGSVQGDSQCDAQREVHCDVQCDPWAPGLRVLTLLDRRDAVRLEGEVHRLTGLLDFVQAHARVGLWERDVNTREGRWDPHMFRFFGLDPARGTPSMPQATLASMPQDQLLDALTASLARPGHYSHRYRLLRPDGSLRRVLTHWVVTGSPDGTPERVVGLVMDDPAPAPEAAPAGAPGVHGAEFQLAIELADVGMWREDLLTGRVHFINPRARALLGIAPGVGDVHVREIRERVHPDDLAEALACHERALQSHRPEDLQARYRAAADNWRHILTRRVTQRNGFGDPIAFSGVALDITEQAERMQHTDELARQLDVVTSSSGIGVWRLRRDDGDAEWNRQLYALCGLPPDRKPPPFDAWVDCCIHPDDRELVRTHGHAWMRDAREPTELACRIVRPDGSVRHVVLRGRQEPEPSLYRLSGVAIDVTERERALEALREATERTAMATRAAGLGIWEWDIDTLQARWDEQMFRLRGLEPRPGSPLLEEMAEYVHPEDRGFVNDQVHRARVEDRTAYYEFRIVRPDGQVRWLASSSMPVRDEKGRTRKRLGVNWDVTEAREAEAARQERALVLRESQAKSELLARMSHELRTPMNAVLGFTQLLLADDLEPAESPRRARLEHIRLAGEHLLTLINDVLELSRLDGPEGRVVLRPVRLDALVAESLPLVERLADQHGVGLLTATRPLFARADPTRLKQVLVNLLTNGIKYNRPGGHVQVETLAERGGVLLRVSDSGVGMTPAQQGQAFEPFNRAGAEREGIEGTGIGLTIVKALVERMGGRIEVRSAPGAGSTFEVRLEAAAESGPHALPARRVLYIEDNAVNVLIVSELVRRHGDIEFDTVPDGASGVARAAQTLPGLVLVDMQLPDIDGMEVLQRLRADPVTAGLVVIALSANAMPEDIEAALQAGFDDYMTKPLDFLAFNRTLEHVFDRR